MSGSETSDGAPTARVWRTPAGVRLCALGELADPGARNFVLQIGAARFHGFVVRRSETVRGYVDRCPHAGLPLARTLDHYLTSDGRWIACAWHGALFDPVDGRCRAGPCAGANLSPWPVQLNAGFIETAGNPDA